MKPLIAASISTRNLIGKPDTAIQDMDKWRERASKQNAELALETVCLHLARLFHAGAR